MAGNYWNYDHVTDCAAMSSDEDSMFRMVNGHGLTSPRCSVASE